MAVRALIPLGRVCSEADAQALKQLEDLEMKLKDERAKEKKKP